MTVQPFSDEQLRLLVNLRQRYEHWMEAERGLAALPYDLRRKTVGGRAYLYEIAGREGNGKSLGRWDDAAEARYERFREEKAQWRERRAMADARLSETARLYRALRLPSLSSDAGPILREADKRGLLGLQLMVVGTNAISAYMVEAAGTIAGLPDETEDFNLAWVASRPDDGRAIWDMLKSVDPTFTVNVERDFQARNARAYEVEILVAPSRVATLGPSDRPRPIPLPEQEWLLLGRPVDQVIGCRDGTPARIVSPDPRWFALHKLWLGHQDKRNPLKRAKDIRQGKALLDTVATAMPHYPLDDAFAADMPKSLMPFLRDWRLQSAVADRNA